MRSFYSGRHSPWRRARARHEDGLDVQGWQFIDVWFTAVAAILVSILVIAFTFSMTPRCGESPVVTTTIGSVLKLEGC